MAHNMDFNKGLYPGEPGYNEWTDERNEDTWQSYKNDSLHQTNSIEIINNGTLVINRRRELHLH